MPGTAAEPLGRIYRIFIPNMISFMDLPFSLALSISGRGDRIDPFPKHTRFSA